ncbi:hypothetical protein, conserved [Plasmodium gonderi]|uniref:Uncharacterized protein n=1 Tax=Plasmodium gonderi TaxID=77519 RepID=A0A1Y1JFS4_PLAGO|nr:hypothetical protein, conserved [Plasmodium gonderi]GAW80195.1 hypothetical protein, conserved [Plasmodium gonderi]
MLLNLLVKSRKLRMIHVKYLSVGRKNDPHHLIRDNNKNPSGENDHCVNYNLSEENTEMWSIKLGEKEKIRINETSINETTPNEMTPSERTPNETTPNETTPNETTPSETSPNETSFFLPGNKISANEWRHNFQHDKENSRKGKETTNVCLQNNENTTFGRRNKKLSKLREFKIATHGGWKHRLRNVINVEFTDSDITTNYKTDKGEGKYENVEKIYVSRGVKEERNDIIVSNVERMKSECKNAKGESVEGSTYTSYTYCDNSNTSTAPRSSDKEYASHMLLNTLYELIERKIDINENTAEELNEQMNNIIEGEKDLKMIFLLLHTMNRLVCIHKYVKKLSPKIYKVQDSELLSIILRITVNSHYKDNELFHFILTKLKEHIKLGTCTTLAISNSLYSYANMYKRNLIQMQDNIPIDEIIQIIMNYYNSFSFVQLLEIIDACSYFSSSKEELLNEKTKNIGKDRLQKSLAKLLTKIGNYFISMNIGKTVPFKNIKEVVYSYAKCKIYHEKLLLHLYPPILKSIKGYNLDISRRHELCNKYMERNITLEEDHERDIIVNGMHTNGEKLKQTERVDDQKVIHEAVKDVTTILYAYSKFYMYIDELYNEILLLLQHVYKYMNCSELSQCLISLSKLHCNIRILLSKVHMERFNIQGNLYRNFFACCTPFDLMNFLLSFSKNLYFEKGVYDVIADLLIREKKIYSLEADDLINIIHAYSKVYYLDSKVFSMVDKILCERIDNNSNYLSPEQAIKYLNSCAKLLYKNENIIYKIIEIIHKKNFINIQIFDLFKILKSAKRLNLSFQRLETHIRMLVPNLTFDFSTYRNHYYRDPKDLHMRKKKWVW